MRHLFAIIVVCTAVSGGVAVADPTNARPAPVSGTSLQDALSGILTGGPGIDVASGQDGTARFTATASGGSLFTLMFERSAFPDGNVFGVYDVADPTNRAPIFGGPEGPAVIKLVTFGPTGEIGVNFATAGLGFSSPANVGFYLDVFGAPAGAGGDGVSSTLDYTYFTEDSLNTLAAPGGEAQALVFRGDGATQLQIPPYAGGTFGDDQFIIAFDDGMPGLGAKDFDDFVVIVESVLPVPEPATGLLAGLGAAMLVLRRRRPRRNDGPSARRPTS
ncbi:MAG: PEP-CTERM sorting domain-containing protein [Phycisphaerae bacterium]